MSGKMKIVARQMPGDPETDLTGIYDVVFGEGRAAITVCVRDGKVEIRSANGPLLIEPRASNTIWCSVAPLE